METTTDKNATITRKTRRKCDMEIVSEIVLLRTKMKNADLMEHHIIGMCYIEDYENVIAKAIDLGYELLNADTASYYIDTYTILQFGTLIKGYCARFDKSGQNVSKIFGQEDANTKSIYMQPGTRGLCVPYLAELNDIVFPIVSLADRASKS